MNRSVKTMAQLKDSRLMFEKKLPLFGYMIIITITMLVIGVIVWSLSAVKPYMIKAACSVTDSNANYVMSAYTGEILESCMSEGDVVQEGDVLLRVKSTDYDIQLEQLEQNRETYKKQISQYEKLVNSIKDNKNHFDAAQSDDELYYSTYEMYQSQVKQNQMDASTFKAYGYSDEQIEAELNKNQGKVAELYYSAIQSAENSIREANTQLETIEAQILALGSGRSEYTIEASTSGVLHLTSDYKKGMVVQAASAVATITPENAGHTLEGYISTSDMARLSKDDEVQVTVDGLNQNVYGTISGRVQQIDSNVTSLENKDGSSSSVFKIRIIPKVDYVVSKPGKNVRLTNGMTCEARIQYDEVTYFDYVMEKLGLLVR